MDCNLINLKLFAYAENILSIDEKSMVEEHLNFCPNCMKIANILTDSIKIIDRQKSVEANPFIYTRIAQKLKSSETENYYSRILKPVLVSIIILISLYGGIRIGNIYMDSNSTNQYSINAVNNCWNDINQESMEVSLLAGNQK